MTNPSNPTTDITKTPSGAVISYDPAAARAATSDEFNKATGKVVKASPADPGVVLAHKQIHASHMQLGNDAGDGMVNYKGLDGKTYRAIDAEASTVGVGGTCHPDDITENQLCAMLGIKPRNNY